MADEYGQFMEDDDFILASVLDESLRHYNDVEVPLRSMNENHPVPSTSSKNVDSSAIVIDLCDSPKKCPTVQSRLSHFFRKPKIDGIVERKINDEKVEKTDQFSVETNSQSLLNVSISNSSSPAIFYKEPDADGFHLSSGSHYVYPSNFPVREYQMTIIKTALFHNTLVSLPTGMGKTFIAAVVMYNFYRWYPMGKIVFMAPTRPLVAQQIEACHSIMGIPKDVTFEMTGNIPPEQRYLAWKKYRVFFLTPQVLANDLSLNKCPSDMIRCIIVDEAHRATKDYAYVQVLRHLNGENRLFRVVGLSATPGTTVEAVCEVVQNLNISKLEFRTDESPDVTKYTNKKDVECIPVKLTNAILHIRTQFLGVYDKYLRRLKQYRALNGNVTNLTKFQILGAKQKFIASNIAREMPKSLVGCLINDFTICMSLAYALELLTIYGIKVFYLQSLELLENHKCLSNDADLQKMLQSINRELNSQDLVWSHPKLIELKKIVQDYFGQETIESSSKIIIFCQYRLVVVEVFELLKSFGSSVKPVMFVGQSLKEKGGLPQKKQLEVMNRFKKGDFNVLIATSVAEEGLDIGEVDLIICLEANKSPIKFVQRLGRTGRKRSGKCITLLTEGKEQMKYKSSVSSSKTLVVKMLKNNTILSKLAQGGPRLVPKHINPQQLMIHVKIPEESILPEKKRKGKAKEENIIQLIEPNNEQIEEENEPNVFQINKAKTKRKSKKRKTAELETNNADIEVEPTVEINVDINSDYHLNDNDLILHENDVPYIVENNDSDQFLAEEEAFNEWVLSCKETNTVILNDPFFKLLNLFVDCSLNNDICDGELVKSNTDGDLKANVSVLYRGEKSSDCIMDMELSSANKHSLENDRHLFHSSNNVKDMDDNKIVPDEINTAEINGVSEYTNDNMNSIDSDDLFVSQKLEEYFDNHNDEFNAKQLNSIGSFQTSKEQESPIILNNTHKIKTVESAKNSYSRKIDFVDLLKSQRANKCNKDYTENITDLRLADVGGSERRDQELLRRDDELIDRMVRFNDDGLTTTIQTDEHDEDDKDDDSIDSENENLVDLFKSQRADTYIEEYNEKIIAEQINDDSDDSLVLINDKLRGSGRKCTAQTAVCREPNDTRHQKTTALNDNSKIHELDARDDAKNVVIDISDDDSTCLMSKGTGSVDYGTLFRGQRSNGYIEDYMDKVEMPRRGNAVAAVEDDDVIFMDDSSPDFLNRKQPKKSVQTKPSDRLTSAPACEIIDLSSPERQPNRADRSTDVRPGNDRAETCAAADSFPLEDDMDFMFVDYCSNSGGGFVTQIERPGYGRVDDDIFTQKPRAEDEDVFTQKPRAEDEDVFTQKPRADDEDVSAQKPRAEDSAVDVFLRDERRTCGHRLTDGPAERVGDTGTSAVGQPPVAARAGPSGYQAVKIAPSTTKPSAFMSHPQSYDGGLLRSFNTLKACQLFKPGFSLKKGAATAVSSGAREASAAKPVAAAARPPVAAVQTLRVTAARTSPAVRARPEDDESPLHVPGHRRRALQFSQSTPKTAAAAGGPQDVRRRPREVVEPAINVLLTSSSDSDVFVGDAESTSHRRPVKRKRRRKPRKKLLFIDDEADVSNNCGDTSMATTTNRIISSEDEDEDNDDDLDSSFIDDLEQSEQSTNMTKQYLQSVKSPANVRGIFKIPQLTTQHFNMDVYSQVDDRNDNSYEEDSFCVRDTSDLNTSSNTSGQKTSDERPSRPRKRRRIVSSTSTDSDDSPNHFKRIIFRK